MSYLHCTTALYSVISARLDSTQVKIEKPLANKSQVHNHKTKRNIALFAKPCTRIKMASLSDT